MNGTPLLVRPRRRSPTGRSATAARSAARWRTPTRPATAGGRGLALDAALVIAGSGGRAPSRPATSSRASSTTALGEGDLLTAVRVPKHTGWGRTTRSSTGWPTSGRRRVAAAVRPDGGRSARRGSALTNMGPTPDPGHPVEQALSAVRRADARRGRRRRGRRHPPGDRPQRDAEYRRHMAPVLTRARCWPRQVADARRS